jgi:ElaA protein
VTELVWSHVRFDELSLPGLYAVLQLRSEVFVVEQGCAFQDLDGLDAQAIHLLGRSEADGTLLAYARCLPSGLKYREASIGRVVSRMSVRGKGVGHALMRQALACLTSSWGGQPIRIGAQARLEQFYRQYGFVPDGELYDEDGIAHIEMIRAG